MAIMSDEANKKVEGGQAKPQTVAPDANGNCAEGYHKDANGNCVKNDDGNDTHPKPPTP